MQEIGKEEMGGGSPIRRAMRAPAKDPPAAPRPEANTAVPAVEARKPVAPAAVAAGAPTSVNAAPAMFLQRYRRVSSMPCPAYLRKLP